MVTSVGEVSKRTSKIAIAVKAVMRYDAKLNKSSQSRGLRLWGSLKVTGQCAGFNGNMGSY